MYFKALSLVVKPSTNFKLTRNSLKFRKAFSGSKVRLIAVVELGACSNTVIIITVVVKLL
jgi:hypothetical protein